MTVPMSISPDQGIIESSPLMLPSSDNPQRIVAGYVLQERLGAGSFATVYKAYKHDDHHMNNTTVDNYLDNMAAIKVINRESEKITKKVLENLELEISILRSYRHPNIVELKHVHKTERHIYLILEFCSGGDVQQLIRSRKVGRISEKLARRLMRDLSAGLEFLWRRQLIHRDIKPQNLLLTGPLPMDEMDDLSKSESEENERRLRNFSSEKFHLKIADFGFARHLQTSTLADTLCGSPLYMAPEILQHKRYDAKADLWSAGAVLFEMISGCPPFTGENHIDLLHNINHKPVRIPRDVRVSKECVNLLRLLLNRNPISRAGFDEFLAATEAFVALGCNGIKSTITSDDNTLPLSDDTSKDSDLQPIHFSRFTSLSTRNSLVPIAEVEESKICANGNVPTVEPQVQQLNPYPDASTTTQNLDDLNGKFSEKMAARTDKSTVNSVPMTVINLVTDNGNRSNSGPRHRPAATGNIHDYPSFAPLETSPPNLTIASVSVDVIRAASPLSLDRLNPLDNATSTQSFRRNSKTYVYSLRGSYWNKHEDEQALRQEGGMFNGDDHEFVMVEHAGIHDRTSLSDTESVKSLGIRNSTQVNKLPQYHSIQNESSLQATDSIKRNTGLSLSPSSPSESSSNIHSKDMITQRILTTVPTSSNSKSPSLASKMLKGLLSTSPGTGGALMGWMNSSPVVTNSRRNSLSSGSTISSMAMVDAIRYNESTNHRVAVTSYVNSFSKNAQMVDLMVKTLATAEDIGRRAIHVAQLGDSLAMRGMKAFVQLERQSFDGNTTTVAPFLIPCDVLGFDEYENKSCSARMYLSKAVNYIDDDDSDMPFAMVHSSSHDDLLAPVVPSRDKNDIVSNKSKVQLNEGDPSFELVNVYFSEALSCYVKSLSLLKSSIHAVQRIIAPQVKSAEHTAMEQFWKRCEGSYQWLSGQFKCIIERADAANIELTKLSTFEKGRLYGTSNDSTGADYHNSCKKIVLRSVEELIHNYALELGRDGMCKQLLGQYDIARTCYRSAGLLVETLLMDPSLVEEDRKELEGYMQGFCDLIMKLDGAETE